MEGLHLTADCFDCLCNPALLTDQQLLGPLLRQFARDEGLTIVGECFHAFHHNDGSAAGFTGTLLLAESHIAIHTWPEREAVTLDVYVCNFEKDNSAKAVCIVDQLIATLIPNSVRRQHLHRGVPSAASTGNTDTNQIIKEHLSQHTSMQTTATKTLVQVRSKFQEIEIAETPEFGRIMRIDGAMMTSVKDEFLYHEALVHPAAISIGGPKTALIIGGGDGGSSKELLKYQSLQQLTLCEIDPEVIQLSKKYLEPIHQFAFDDERLQIRHEDGFTFIQKCHQQFDLILLDLTDPVAPNGNALAESCMHQQFFLSCYEALHEGGALVLHLGSRFYHPQRYSSTLDKLRSTFDLVRPYSVFIPLYGALWGMAIAIKRSDAENIPDPLAFNEDTITRAKASLGISDLRYYTAQTHMAMFHIDV